MQSRVFLLNAQNANFSICCSCTFFSYLFESAVSMLFGWSCWIVTVIIQTQVWWVTWLTETFKLSLFIINQTIVSGSLWLKTIKLYWVCECTPFQKCFVQLPYSPGSILVGVTQCLYSATPDWWCPNEQIQCLLIWEQRQTKTLKVLCRNPCTVGFNVQMFVTQFITYGFVCGFLFYFFLVFPLRVSLQY